MKTYRVSDLMVPLSEYATVSEDATLYEAVMELERAQQEFDQNKYRHRAILVYDKNKTIIGKLGQIDVLQALEPKYNDIVSGRGMGRFGFTKQFMMSMIEDYHLFDQPLREVCQKANVKTVTDFMSTFTESEHIELEASLDQAIHQFVLSNQQSLLVVHGEDIVGILRLTDVFVAVFHTMKECAIDG